MIFAAAPVGIGHHRLAADLVEGDVLRGMPRAGGDRQRREDPVRIARRPFQHLHAAHRAADHRKQLVDAEMIDQHRLRAHHVADGDDRQVEPVGLAGRRIGRGRAGRAEAAADDVRADDEEAVGVDDLAGADQHLPPARLAGDRIGVGDVLVAGQRMADQHGVGLVPHSACRRSGRRSGTATAARRRRASAAGPRRSAAPGWSGRWPHCRCALARSGGHRSILHSSRIAAGNKKPALRLAKPVTVQTVL